MALKGKVEIIESTRQRALTGFFHTYNYGQSSMCTSKHPGHSGFITQMNHPTRAISLYHGCHQQQPDPLIKMCIFLQDQSHDSIRNALLVPPTFLMPLCWITPWQKFFNGQQFRLQWWLHFKLISFTKLQQQIISLVFQFCNFPGKVIINSSNIYQVS